MDVVDESNLQRQILHNMDRIGDRKVDSAKKTLTLLNPDVNVVTYDVRLGADNVLSILDGYDVVVDGTDNFPTRFLVNDASVKLGIPVVHGSIFRFEGMVTVFDPQRGPTYRDMVPEPPPAELAPSCAEAGVLGVLPGHRRLASRPSRRSSCSSTSATRSSGGCSPTTASSSRSASSRSRSIRPTRSRGPTATASWSPSSTTSACPTRCRRRRRRLIPNFVCKWSKTGPFTQHIRSGGGD